MNALQGLYHADKLDEQSFIDNFTIRLKEFQQIMNNLREQRTKPLQHFLITGKRGMGKSTLLRRIYIEVQNTSLKDKMFCVRLGTEQYRLSRLYKLWEQVIENLAREAPELEQKRKETEDSKEYEEHLTPIIGDYLAASGKTLLLLIDNFDQLIDKITEKDRHALREALMLYPVQIIGNTVFYNEQFFSYNNPFFDFFKPIKLTNLNKKEAEDFIRDRARNEGIENFEKLFKKQKGKITALRILSGGVPRTLLILLSIISRRNTGDAVDYLHEMIEQVTPLYQDRMKSLSPQQQEIMHHLAMHWDRTPVKELAAEMRIPSKSISAQLLQLENCGYINKVDIPGRNHYYEIDERFFNIWLLMSEAAPYDTKRVIWLTKWLDSFYSADELRDFASFCCADMKEVKPTSRFLIALALSESEKLDIGYKKRLVKDISDDLKEKMTEVKVWEKGFNEKLLKKEEEIGKEIIDLINKKKYNEALLVLEDFEMLNEPQGSLLKGMLYEELSEFEKSSECYLIAAKKGDVNAMTFLGDFYLDKKRDTKNAEKYYLMASSKGDAYAMKNLGDLYLNKKGDIENAEKYYLMASNKGNAYAMKSLGDLCLDKKRDTENAEKYYLMASEKDNVYAIKSLGDLYLDKKRDIGNAEKYYLMASNKGDANAMKSLGDLYLNIKGDIENAEKYYLMASNNGNTYAMNDLGDLYLEKKKDTENAEKYYLMASEKDNVYAMISLGDFYLNEKKEIAKAERYYLMAIEKGSEYAMACFGSYFLKNKGDVENAEKYYLMAAQKGHTFSMIMLANFYITLKRDFVTAEKYIKMAIDSDNEYAKPFVAQHYFLQNDIAKKAVALDYFTPKILEEGLEVNIISLSYVQILLWNGKINDAHDAIKELLTRKSIKDNSLLFLSAALQYFLVFHQTIILQQLLNYEQNKDRFKPLYFALMHEMKDEYPKEYLRMPEELKEPVEGILEFVRKERERLGLV